MNYYHMHNLVSNAIGVHYDTCNFLKDRVKEIVTDEGGYLELNHDGDGAYILEQTSKGHYKEVRIGALRVDENGNLQYLAKRHLRRDPSIIPEDRWVNLDDVEGRIIHLAIEQIAGEAVAAIPDDDRSEEPHDYGKHFE